MTVTRIVDINGKKKYLKKNTLIAIFQFCLFGLSLGDCTIVIQPLADNHPNLVKQFFKHNCI